MQCLSEPRHINVKIGQHARLYEAIRQARKVAPPHLHRPSLCLVSFPMLLAVIPQQYWPDIDPALLRAIANVAISLTPLYTYGTACYSIHRRRLSAGFSIDICATMLMASILRILYYFVTPFEPLLLRQALVMTLVQCALLRVLLHHRPATYSPDGLAARPPLAPNLAAPRLLGPRFYLDMARALGAHALRLFDVHYRRPGCFWQWREEAPYWRFLAVFSAVFAVLTGLFRSSPWYGAFIGTLGLFIEALLPLPQILMLQRLGTVENFKVILLVSWLGGDCLKLSYLFFGTDNVSSIFVAAALFQMGLDLIILAQYLHFWAADRRRASLPMYEMEALPPVS